VWAAFTLVELLAVTILIAVVAGVATLRLDGFSARGRLRAAARQLGAFVRVTQTDARTTGRPVVLRYESDSGTIAALRPTVEGVAVVWVRRPGIELAGAVNVMTATGISNSGDDADDGEHFDVRVDADGFLETHDVRLALASGRYVDVRIDGVTGEAAITEPEGQVETNP